MLFKQKVRENKKEETEMTQKKGKRPYKKGRIRGWKTHSALASGGHATFSDSETHYFDRIEQGQLSLIRKLLSAELLTSKSFIINHIAKKNV
jgi:hypothetical protein